MSGQQHEFAAGHGRDAHATGLWRRARRAESGQTIVVAIIILSVLLIMGFVFLGIINHNVNTTGFMQVRSRANDLSEAGIRYAHEQMLHSELGADWRGQPTPMIDASTAVDKTTTIDPDAFFLRPPATDVNGNSLPWPGSQFVDLGGPDGLGPYFRVNFQNGRAMVRTRYAPSDANIFRATPAGPLRNPGLARNYIIIESVGRDGVVSSNDPTLLQNVTPHRYEQFQSAEDFANQLAAFRQDQAKYGGVHVNQAFASIGIIESGIYITNKYHVSTPAEIGIPTDMGASNRDGTPVAASLIEQLGTSLPLLTFEAPGSPSTTTVPYPMGGSLFSNADLLIHGSTNSGVIANLNLTLGDEWDVAGQISGDSTSVLNFTTVKQSGSGWTQNTMTLSEPMFDSKSSSFTTDTGAIRDGASTRGADGFSRSIGRKEPPTADGVDPVTGINRYQSMTRDSGAVSGTGNSGAYGFGQGVYVNNFSDFQGGTDENSRTNAGGAGSLVNDWLNPNSAGGNWNGYLYVPPGAYVQLLSDGFLITRDGLGPQAERTWRLTNGVDTGVASLRYRIGRGTDRRMRIINANTPVDPTNPAGTEGAAINGNLGTTDFDNGQPFNGVLYFEGNVRVRGIIPTDVQLSIVSHATIYVEGSITKGITGNQWTATYLSQDSMPATAVGQIIARPSKSMLILMAKDYVALNTTQFYGQTGGSQLIPEPDIPNSPGYNALRIPIGSTLSLQHEFELDPNGPNGAVPSNPQTWRPFAADYFVPGAPANKITTSMLVSQTMDDGPASASFISLNINAQSGNYIFPTANPPYANSATAYTNATTLYGLGVENYQRFNLFESVAFPLIDPNVADLTVGTNTMVGTASNPTGTYTLFDQGANQFTLQPTSINGQASNDYVLGRFSIVPDDIRIEASMFAEEGSFFVIPGLWFNPNPNDTYARYSRADDTTGSPLTTAQMDARRVTEFGASTMTPFYGEPIDARIIISGSVSENMPPTASQQSEYLRKWGWIPMYLGTSGQSVPSQHVPTNNPSPNFVPNIIITYDPVLATGRRFGFVDPSSTTNLNDPGTYVRTEWIDFNMDGIQEPTELVALPPLPRLPVSPTLAYFGEEH